MAVLVTVAGCAADPGDFLPDAGDAPASADARTDIVADRPSGSSSDTAADAPMPDGPTQTEPPLMVRACEDGSSETVCCRSAIDFEDDSTEHFLPATCCRLALSAPQLTAMPTACGHGALKLAADFRATDDTSLCGTPAESPACARTAGEVTRAVLAPLNLSGRTASVMAYLQGPPLPPNPVYGTLFIVGTAGVVEGAPALLSRTDAWTPIELAVPADPTAPGAAVQVLGIRLDFRGQAWAGQAYLDELTWR